jgi:4-amino-4-deoxy-L-arabinose transferase-like glycosyltransferase
MKPNRHIRYLVLILLLAAVLRLLWILLVPTEPISDFAVFDRLAANIVAGRGYVSADGSPTTYRPPGYPFFLAGIYAVFGHGRLEPRLVNVLLGVITCGLAYLVAARLFNQQTGLVAALIVAAFPSHILYANLLATENLFIPLLLTAVAAFLFAVQGKQTRARYLVASGVLLGLCALTRPAVALVPAAWGAALLWKRTAIRDTVFSIILVGAAMVATIAPWTVRNAIVADEFIPVATEGGITFLAGHNERAIEGHYSLEGPVFDDLYAVDRSEADFDAYAYKLAFQFIRENPDREFILLARKFFHFFKDDVSGVNWNDQSSTVRLPNWVVFGLKAVAQAYYIAVAALAITALVRRPQRRDGWYVLLYAVFIYWTALHLAFYGKDRFRLPLMPFFAIFAAVTLATWLVQRHRWLELKETHAMPFDELA